MGISKTDLFTLEQNNIAVVAKALAHPARVAILHYLIKSNTCINGELVNELGLAQATISQHLRELKQVGLIKGTIEGTSVNYCIDTDNWKKMQHLLNTLFDQPLSCDDDACC